MPDKAEPQAPHLLPPSPDELLRCQVIAELRSKLDGGKNLEEAASEIAARTHFVIQSSKATSVTARSIYRWWSKFKAKSWSGLRTGRSEAPRVYSALPANLLEFLRAEKKLDRYASVPEMLRRARELAIIGSDESFDRITVWRACKRLGLPLRRVPGKREIDSRRFAYPHRMMMVLADGKHFRASHRRTRRVVLFFLDDATRLGLCAVVGTAEDAALFLRGLYRVVRQHGLMDGLYADHGCGFTANDSVAALAQMGVLLVHGEVAYPEGRGKVERFNRTADSQLLRHLDGRADVDPDCGALELRIQHFLERRYDLAPHESLDGLSPQARWEGDARPLRFPESDVALRRCFVIRETRRVSRDHVISFEGVAYEAPRGHAGTTVAVHRHLLDQTLSVMHDGRLVALHSVDLAVNARARRASPREQDETTAPLPPSAAELQWRRDFAPLTGPDGAFADTSDDEEIT